MAAGPEQGASRYVRRLRPVVFAGATLLMLLGWATAASAQAGEGSLSPASRPAGAEAITPAGLSPPVDAPSPTAADDRPGQPPPEESRAGRSASAGEGPSNRPAPAPPPSPAPVAPAVADRRAPERPSSGATPPAVAADAPTPTDGASTSVQAPIRGAVAATPSPPPTAAQRPLATGVPVAPGGAQAATDPGPALEPGDSTDGRAPSPSAGPHGPPNATPTADARAPYLGIEVADAYQEGTRERITPAGDSATGAGAAARRGGDERIRHQAVEASRVSGRVADVRTGGHERGTGAPATGNELLGRTAVASLAAVVVIVGVVALWLRPRGPACGRGTRSSVGTGKIRTNTIQGAVSGAGPPAAPSPAAATAVRRAARARGLQHRPGSPSPHHLVPVPLRTDETAHRGPSVASSLEIPTDLEPALPSAAIGGAGTRPRPRPCLRRGRMARWRPLLVRSCAIGIDPPAGHERGPPRPRTGGSPIEDRQPCEPASSTRKGERLW